MVDRKGPWYGLSNPSPLPSPSGGYVVEVGTGALRRGTTSHDIDDDVKASIDRGP